MLQQKDKEIEKDEQTLLRFKYAYERMQSQIRAGMIMPALSELKYMDINAITNYTTYQFANDSINLFVKWKKGNQNEAKQIPQLETILADFQQALAKKQSELKAQGKYL